MLTADIRIANAEPPRGLPLIRHALRVAWQNCAGSMQFWAWLVIVGFYVDFLAVAAERPLIDARWLWTIVMLPTGCMLSTLFADHFASVRARLVPGYRQVHLAALVVSALASFALLAALTSIWSVGPLWRYTGAAVFALAIGCWWLGSAWILVIAVWLYLFLACFTSLQSGPVAFPTSDPGNFWLLAMWLAAFGTTDAGNLFLLALGGLLLAWFFWWLWHLAEDGRGYDKVRLTGVRWRMVFSSRLRSRWVQPNKEDGRGSWQAEIVMPWDMVLRERLLEAMLRHDSKIPGWKLLRWDLAWGSLQEAISGGFLLLLLIAGTCAMFGQNAVTMVRIEVAVFFVVWQAATLLARKRRSLPAVELLRPETRENLLKQWAAGLLLSPIAALVFAVGYAVVEPQRRRAIGSPPDLADVFVFFAWMCVTAALTGLLAGVAVFVRSFRKSWLDVSVGLLELLIFFLVVSRWAGDEGLSKANAWDVLAGAEGLAVLAAIAFRLAYRRWLTIDLG